MIVISPSTFRVKKVFVFHFPVFHSIGVNFEKMTLFFWNKWSQKNNSFYLKIQVSYFDVYLNIE